MLITYLKNAIMQLYVSNNIQSTENIWNINYLMDPLTKLFEAILGNLIPWIFRQIDFVLVWQTCATQNSIKDFEIVKKNKYNMH